MQLTLFDATFSSNVFAGVVATIIVSAAGALYRWATSSRPTTLALKHRWGYLATSGVVGGFALAASASGYIATQSYLVASWVFSASLIVLTFTEFYRLQKVGILGVDQEVATGYDYSAALRAANNGIDFFGDRCI